MTHFIVGIDLGTTNTLVASVVCPGGVCDEGAMLDVVRRVQQREWVDRLEATVEAHILPVAKVREDAPFGVVLIHKGEEVGANTDIYSIGTTATNVTSSLSGTIEGQVVQSHPIEEIEALIDKDNDWVKLVPNTKAASLAELTPTAVSGTLAIPVGRVRKMKMGPQYVAAFTCGDQLLWGAAEPLRRMLRILLERA